MPVHYLKQEVRVAEDMTIGGWYGNADSISSDSSLAVEDFK